MGRLTTHVLDLSAGCPGSGIRVELTRVDGAARIAVTSAVTNSDGRCDKPILEGETFRLGWYELAFHVGDYFAARGIVLPEPKFLDIVVIRFGIAAGDQHYHVPLLVSPYGYSTYRGS